MSRIQANKEYILSTGIQLENGVPLTVDQMLFWGQHLRRIGEGEDPSAVLNLKRKPGESAADDEQRKKISHVMALIASYHKPIFDPRLPKPKKYTLEQAINKIIDKVPEMMGDGGKYDFDQVMSWWKDRNKRHMRSPIRNKTDRDNPY
jgi:hypothetical protein